MNSVFFTVLATIAGANAVSLRDILSNHQIVTLLAANSVVEATLGLKGNGINKKVLSTAALIIKSDMIAAGCYDDESLHFASCFATVCLGTFLHLFNSEIHISNAHLSFDDAVNSTEKVATGKKQSQNRVNILGMQKVVYTADDCLNTEDNQTTQ
ncbi:hypothetical protein SARC_12688 [Sphaeroforma arctica JP610]|uniref:Uncharacterized protein n=1 Tax=Sphaeroforma arctica JP610 TaxID=667725 RepID=A0A0L0FFF3_9EUKA|nr:hypothetical protein SARC_12688 [Sphaeroforma arctica JP610]KNC74773.1 hypothetical protein SARC_12688 [Sphaeroforma arctica JP610]|eukprot:XP_014148675.1 hypothetical protein SARC_12688 [Sphaeroforma arctica JP610]